MKILHTVQFYWPIVGGAQEAVRQISEKMVSLGHEVTVATTKCSERKFNELNGVKIKEFEISGNLVNGFNGNTREYIDFLKNSQFDVIMNYAAQQWATDLMLTIIDEVAGKKVFVPCGFSALYDNDYSEYYENMKNWLKKYDSCVYLSGNYQDINFAKKCGAENSIIIPNGADEKEFLLRKTGIREKLRINKDNFLILHVGSHTGLKGHKEAIEIYRLSKIPNSTFLIVGNNLSFFCTFRCKFLGAILKYSPNFVKNKKEIIITELSRDDTVTSYFDSDIFLFPSNVECSPIVLFECMASGTPFLVTDVGNSCEIVEYSHAGMLLPSIKTNKGLVKADVSKSVPILEELFKKKSLRDKMSRDGRSVWEKQFTWTAIAKNYEILYNNLVRMDK